MRIKFASTKAQAWHEAAELLRTEATRMLVTGALKPQTKRRVRRLEAMQHMVDHVIPSLSQKAEILESNARETHAARS